MPEPRGNRLLEALTAGDRDRLAPALEEVDLDLRQTLFLPNQPIEHVYFLDAGVASVVSDQDGSRIEVATVGREGLVGLPVFLGTGTVPLTCFVQIPGRAHRMSSRDLVEATSHSAGRLRQLLSRYTEALMFQIAQSAACRSMHPIEQRCGRWLLITHDRVDGDRFTLTHEFMAQMLGVRRATVSEVQEELKRRGLIDYTRGDVTILDRPGLEASTCVCYQLIAREHDRVPEAELVSAR